MNNLNNVFIMEFLIVFKLSVSVSKEVLVFQESLLSIWVGGISPPSSVIGAAHKLGYPPECDDDACFPARKHAGSLAFTPPGDEMSKVLSRCLPHIQL